jgi:hypothetical protein
MQRFTRAPAAHCCCPHSRPSAATAPAKAAEPGGERLLLQAEPPTRTDSRITSTVKSQHISDVGFGSAAGSSDLGQSL